MLFVRKQRHEKFLDDKAGFVGGGISEKLLFKFAAEIEGDPWLELVEELVPFDLVS